MSANAPMRPTSTPAAASRSAPPSTRRSTPRACAPSAIRIPSSRVRCATEYEITPKIPTAASNSDTPPNDVSTSVMNRGRDCDAATTSSSVRISASGKRGIHVAQRGAHRAGEGVRRARGAHRDVRGPQQARGRRHLCVWQVEGRPRWLVDAHVLHVRYDPDDGERVVFGREPRHESPGRHDVPPERARLAPNRTRERLVHDHRLGALRVVARVEETAGEELYLHRVEVARAHELIVVDHGEQLARWGRRPERMGPPSTGSKPFDHGSPAEVGRERRQRGAHRDALDARNRGRALEEPRPKRSRGFAVIALLSEPNRHRRDRPCVESRVDAREVPERPQHEPGAREQDQRERELTDDQRLAQALPSRAGRRRGPGRADHVVQVAFRDVRERREPEQHARREAGRDGEQQHSAVDAGVARERNRDDTGGGDRDQRGVGEQHSEPRAEQRQEHSLRRERAREARQIRAERAADSDLALPRFGAREQQVGDVHARDQQQEGDRAEQHPERGPHLAHDFVTQPVRTRPVPVRIEMMRRARFRRARDERVELRLRLRQRHARLQPTQHPDAVIVDR